MFTGMGGPSAPSDLKMAAAETEKTTIQVLRQTIKNIRRSMAYQIVDMFESIDSMDEKEFIEMISELDGNGIVMSEMVEKFRRYKGQ